MRIQLFDHFRTDAQEADFYKDMSALNVILRVSLTGCTTKLCLLNSMYKSHVRLPYGSFLSNYTHKVKDDPRV